MDNTTNTVPDQSVASNTQSRRISRTGLLWIAVACSLLGIVTLLVWLQSATRALAMAQAQVAESRRLLPQDTFNTTALQTGRILNPQLSDYRSAGDALPPINGMLTAPSPNSPYQSTTPIVEEQFSVPIVDPRTGRVEMATEARIQQLASQYRNAEPGQKEMFSKGLTQVLTDLFDARHKAQSSRVEALKIEVQQTQELLDKRLQNKSKIIERRVKELTGQQDELSWNTSVPVANPGSPRAENSPIQPPIQNPAYYPPTNNTVPFAGTPYPTPINSAPFSPPSDNYPSPSPASIPPTSPVFDSAPSQTIRASDLTVDESLPTPNANPNPTPISLPFNASPSSNNPVNAPLELGPPSNSPVINNPVKGPLESQRSFMNIGFKLKGLMRQLEGEQSIKGATKVKSEIEESKSVWEFEKSSLQSELESVESEYQLVTKQLEQAREQVDIQKARVDAGTSTDAQLNYSKAEVAKSEVERQLLQLRSRMTTTKKSIDWMENFFKEKPASPPSTVAEPEVLPLVGS